MGTDADGDQVSQEVGQPGRLGVEIPERPSLIALVIVQGMFLTLKKPGRELGGRASASVTGAVVHSAVLVAPLMRTMRGRVGAVHQR